MAMLKPISLNLETLNFQKQFKPTSISKPSQFSSYNCIYNNHSTSRFFSASNSEIPIESLRSVEDFNPRIPLQEALTPPSSWYTDPSFLALEFERVFYRGWQAVEMQQQSLVDKMRKGAFGTVRQGQKRNAPETASPAPTQDAPPPPKAKSSVKLVSSSGRGAGSSRTVATSAGTLPPPARSGDNVFRPNWAVQKTDTGLGESRVAVEIQSKCILDKDKQQVLHEPPATAEEAVFSSLYQIGVYFNDLRGKSKKFSDAITKSKEENGKLKKDVKELKKSVEKSADEIKRPREDFAAQLAAQKEEATEALNTQRERALSRQATTVQEKEDELLLLSSEAYKIGFFDCLGQVKDSNPGVDLSRMVITDPPTLTGEEPAAADALLPPGADSARMGAMGRLEFSFSPFLAIS
ncbi:choline monooxygenase, putative (CMO-like) isoform X4 [Tasmannia lanceolata]|uniref:choline monooxygenase, putative (CMO-like) isoform X4 n=1 Tax=Tasmannia lanceolata TaxID=3420 RepID=UPI004063B11C